MEFVKLRQITPKWSGLEIDVEALGPKEEDAHQGEL